MACPLPGPASASAVTTRAPADAAVAAVASVEPSSTTSTSATCVGPRSRMPRTTAPTVRASSRAGITTLTNGWSIVAILSYHGGSSSRAVEGPGPMTLRQPVRKDQVPMPGTMRRPIFHEHHGPVRRFAALSGVRARPIPSRRSTSASGASARSRSPTTTTPSAASISREKIAAGPTTIWRYADLLPAERRSPVDLGAGFTPLVRADRLAAELGLGELWIKNDTVNPTNSFKDRVVSVALSKALEFGFKVAACASTGNLANSVAAHAARAGMRVDRVHPPRPRAGQGHHHRRLRRHARRRRRQLRRRQPAVRRADRRRTPGRSST